MYSKSRENSQKYDVLKKDKSLNQSSMSLSSATAPFLLSSLCLPILFIFYVIYTPTLFHFSSITNNELPHRKSHNDINIEEEEEQCDLFKGRWVWDQQGSLYTNVSCTTIPHLRNCLLHGRMDRDFLSWRWKPDQCDLPRFDAKAFMSCVQGKTMAFIGDSLGRNQMESLLCLLSSEESPKQVFKDDEDRFTTWHFPVHNFTLMALWSQFLVKATEKTVNGSSTGSFDLHLDIIDDRWSKVLPKIDYAIFSDAHWFFRQHSLYEDGKLIGCVYCQSPNVTDLGPNYAIRKAFRAAFDRINNCSNCSGIVTFLRTFSPAHFENGSWDEGGGCNRTRPYTEEEVTDRASGADAEYRKVQVEEIERARKEGEKWGNKFEVVDITKAMLLRSDGHPGLYWGNKWMKGYNDCIHWCLPGPVDTWNELLLYMLRKQPRHRNPPTN